MSAPVNIDTGGNSYPSPCGHLRVNDYQPGHGSFIVDVPVATPGLTLLDHFAGLAMQGFFSMEDVGYICGQADAFAKSAYDMAAAMVAEKRRREGGN